MNSHVVALAGSVCVVALTGTVLAEELDIDGLAAGTVVSSVNGTGGTGPIGVNGINPNLASNAAVIFDSANPTGDDDDLGTPADSCGGPGNGGAAVGAGTQFENCTDLFNLLIIDDDLSGEPDDIDFPAIDGAIIEFDFSGIGGTGTVTAESIRVIDIDGNGPNPRVELYDSSDNPAGTFPIPQTPGNGVATISLGDTPGVARIEVWLQGSAALDTIFFTPDEEPPLGICRVTGGANGESPSINGNGEANGNANGNGNGNGPVNRWHGSAQAGAPNGSFGEWNHHNLNGPDGHFQFHGGTSSASDGTFLNVVECGDEENCHPARPAPFKQIRFQGVGEFHVLGNNVSDAFDDVVARETLHWFEVRINDLGEPGTNNASGQNSLDDCQEGGYDIFEVPGDLANCDCPDYYEIVIYHGSSPASDVLYAADGYIEHGGNYQIHPALNGGPQAP